jgi:rfaE bifunctional protein nucleotidyltransferase chain/domain
MHSRTAKNALIAFRTFRGDLIDNGWPAGADAHVRDKLQLQEASSSSPLCLHGDPLNRPVVLTLDEAILWFGREKRNRRRIVFTNGCFDVLHPGHIRSLEQARDLGDALIVGLNSDTSVRQLKGAGRPVLPEQERAEILAALECVDGVVVFDDLTPREVISRLLPDVLVKGGDWAGDKIVGREEVEAAGGRVVSAPVVPGYSTTDILRKIRETTPDSRVDS